MSWWCSTMMILVLYLLLQNQLFSWMQAQATLTPRAPFHILLQGSVGWGLMHTFIWISTYCCLFVSYCVLVERNMEFTLNCNSLCSLLVSYQILKYKFSLTRCPTSFQKVWKCLHTSKGCAHYICASLELFPLVSWVILWELSYIMNGRLWARFPTLSTCYFVKMPHLCLLLL